MNCQEIQGLLSGYLDGELPAEQARQVAEHLRDCPSCEKELESLRYACRLVGSLAPEQLSVDLAAAVVARASAPRWRERWARLGGLLAPRQAFISRQVWRAAVVLALFLLAMTVPGRGPSDLIIAWPARVAGTAQTGMAYFTAGLSRAEAFFNELESPRSSRRVSSRRGGETSWPGGGPAQFAQCAQTWAAWR